MIVVNNQYTSQDTSQNEYLKSKSCFIFQKLNSYTNKKSFEFWLNNKHFANLIRNPKYDKTKTNSPIYTIHFVNKATHKTIKKSQGIILVRQNNKGFKFFLIPQIKPYFTCDYFIHNVYQKELSFHYNNNEIITPIYYKGTSNNNNKDKVENPKQNKTMKGNKNNVIS